MIKFTPDMWQKILAFQVIDPDGWDRSGDFQADWNKPLSLDEFLDKADVSTCTRRTINRELLLDIAAKNFRCLIK